MITTQVAGPVSRHSSLFSLKYRLKKAGLAVRFPLNDGLSLLQGRYFSFNPQKWLKYEVELDYFQSIANSDVHIISNDSVIADGVIDKETSLSMLYAMLQNKPIVVVKEAVLTRQSDHLLHEILKTRQNLIHQLPLRSMPEAEIQMRLAELEPVDYKLTPREENLIKFRLKSHFRELLHPNRYRKTFFAAIR